MKKLSRVLMIIATAAMLFSCGPGWKQNHNGNQEPVFSMRNAYVMQASSYQVDSICVADTLPSLNEWISSTFKDYEDGTTIVKRVYVKEYQSGNQNIYVITGKEEPYSVTKRIKEKK
jgi:hypothetical protein